MLNAMLKVMAMARPAALPVPAERKVSALTSGQTLDRWGKDAAGVRALSSGDNIITIFDVIGEDFWSEGITAKSITRQLRAIGDRPIEVQINSPGGDMFEGIAIYNVLREHSQPVTIKIMGMAASAASIIAMAGDNVEIGAASFLMIHNCWVVSIGNRLDMVEVSEWLEPFDSAMAEVYAARTGKTVAECASWMDAETYMSGSVAVERGFADELLAADKLIDDPEVLSADRELNHARSMELTLVSSGMTRSQARAHIKELKGTPGAAPTATPGAGKSDASNWMPDAQALLAAMNAA